MKVFASAALFLTFGSTAAEGQVNAGTQSPEPSVPFTVTQVTTFNLPWRIAFLPDGRMLITEKPGSLWLVTQQGAKTPVANAVVDGPAGDPEQFCGMVQRNAATDTRLEAVFRTAFRQCHSFPPDAYL